jgi:hypothetical protein
VLLADDNERIQGKPKSGDERYCRTDQVGLKDGPIGFPGKIAVTVIRARVREPFLDTLIRRFHLGESPPKKIRLNQNRKKMADLTNRFCFGR